MGAAHEHNPVLFSCKLWVHDDSFSTRDVLFNLSAFSNASLSEGALLIALPAAQSLEPAPKDEKIAPKRSGFVFLARDCDPDVKSKHSNLQLSVSSKVARLYGFKNLMEVSIAKADQHAHSATHVELCFRDVYLTRADLHRLVTSSLLNRTLFEGESITFLGSVVRSTVKSVYIHGKRVRSGFFSNQTKPIFRSESARYVLYVQMSREMWEFDTEGSGEIIFNKVVKSVLPELFRRWTDLNARHLVSVVLFTRLEPQHGKAAPVHHSHCTESFDFYRVVVAEMYSGESATILHELQKEFKHFLKEVLTHSPVDHEDKAAPPQEQASSYQHGNVSNVLTPAKTGNVLEAINLATSRFARDWIDPDLVRTGLTIIIITPGPGYFHVDQKMLRLTNENLVRNGVSIDLLCLSQPPLHQVPLFGFHHPLHWDNQDLSGHRQNNSIVSPLRSISEHHSAVLGEVQDNSETTVGLEHSSHWTYVVPQWIQIHFWSTSHNIAWQKNKADKTSALSSNLRASSGFIPSCRMYEVQMTGIMENEMCDISIPYLHMDKMNILAKAQQQSSSKAPNSYRMSFHDSPPKSIYLDSRYGQPASSNPPISRRSKSFEQQEWMDEYDKAVFTDFSANSAYIPSASGISYPHGRTDRLTPSTTATATNGSNHNSTYSSPKSYTTPRTKHANNLQSQTPARNLDRALQRPPPPLRTTSKDSLQSQIRSRPLTHLLPLGSSTKAGVKATPTMQHASETVTSSPAARDNAVPSDGRYEAITGPISRQVRTSLLRHSSASKIEKAESDDSPPSQISTAVDVPQHASQEPQASLPDPEPTTSVQGKQSTQLLFTSRSAADHTDGLLRKPDSVLSEERSFILATAPWLTVCNPCQLGSQETGFAGHHGWTHVFVRPNMTFGMKWKSLCSPALLPLASDFTFSPEALATHEENSYKVTLPDDELVDVLASRARLINSLLSFRLGKGFQLLPKASSIVQNDENGDSIHFSEEMFREDNITLRLSKGNTIHSIHVSGSEIQVTCYRPQESSNSSIAVEYMPLIKTTFARSYEPRKLDLSLKPDDLNWSVIDNFLAGYPATLTNSIGFWRARFVLIPIGPPSSAKGRLPALAEDSDDEVYIEGIQRLTQIWERLRLTLSDPQSLQAWQQTGQKDHTPNPLNLEFQTRDASAVIVAGLDESLLHEDKSPFPSSQLFSAAESYNTGKVDLHQLADDLQNEKGIKMHDRRWHFRLHSNCFVGLDLTSWLLHNFQDIDSREAAIELGQSLMDRGLFKHVSGRHNFRDGNYFYQITSEYRAAKAESRQSWFSWKPEKGSAPPTPQLDGSIDFTSSSKSISKAGRADSAMPPSSSESPSNTTKKKPTVRLSSMIQCDIDIRKKSDRLEVVDLHFDRLYNPDSCYHFRLEWMNTTAKLVEDAIITWSSYVEKYGLKLVQVPLVEASRISETNPYRSPYIVELAVPPPKTTHDIPLDVQSPTAQSLSTSSINPFLRALLRKLGFILESEASSNFPSNVRITYSWGNDVPYLHTQYIHKTGVILAQVTIDDKLLLVANRLADARAVHSRDSLRIDKRGKRDESSIWSSNSKDTRLGASSTQRKSTPASPLIVPSTETAPQYSHMEERNTSPPTAEQIKDEVEAFCHDANALRTFFDESTLR